MTKTKTQKARARAAKAKQSGAHRQSAAHKVSTQGRRKKWFIGVDNFRMGSGDAPKPKRSRTRNGGLDMVSLAPEERGTTPSFARGQVVQQDEFVGILSASVGFQCTTFVLQPGLVANNPWLAQISQLYQKYKILRWEYYFKPIVSEYDPIGQRGKVIMSFDSDVAGQLLTTFQQAEGLQPHVDFMPYQKATLPLSGRLVSQTSTGLFIRTGAPPAGSDPKTYDAGILYVCTQGMSGSGSMGELHVRYSVELFNPVLPNVIAAPINYKYTGVAQNGFALTSGVWTQCTSPTVSPNGLGLSVVGGSITMAAGLIRISYSGNVTVSAGNATQVYLQVKVNGVTLRGTVSGFTLTTGAVTPVELNGSFIITYAGGEIITFGTLATFTGTAVSDLSLQITTV